VAAVAVLAATCTPLAHICPSVPTPLPLVAVVQVSRHQRRIQGYQVCRVAHRKLIITSFLVAAVVAQKVSQVPQQLSH